MRPRPRTLGWLGALLLLLGACSPADAARARFHYFPADGCGNLRLAADGPCGAPGERVSWFGTVRQPDCRPPRCNQLVTFQHRCTGRPVVVPLSLPEGTPNMEYRSTRVIYNYGSYTVEVHFLPDGSVDVVYNSGFLRGL